jgi:hypothetical protein
MGRRASERDHKRAVNVHSVAGQQRDTPIDHGLMAPTVTCLLHPLTRSQR